MSKIEETVGKDPFVLIKQVDDVDVEVVHLPGKGMLMSLDGELSWLPHLSPDIALRLEPVVIARIEGGTVRAAEIPNEGVMVFMNCRSVLVKDVNLSIIQPPREVYRNDQEDGLPIFVMQVGALGGIVIVGESLQYIPGLAIRENVVDSGVTIS